VKVSRKFAYDESERIGNARKSAPGGGGKSDEYALAGFELLVVGRCASYSERGEEVNV